MALEVKNIAKRPAKNINSLESHTTVPTLTRFGRESEWTFSDSNAGVAVVTRVIMPAQPVTSEPGVGRFAKIVMSYPASPVSYARRIRGLLSRR
ncbi:hypothetical protein GCM10027298_19170 [Epidermidibacterium keratini]